MKMRRLTASPVIAAGLLFATAAFAQQAIIGNAPAVNAPTGVIVPILSIIKAGDAGQLAHTNVKILNFEGGINGSIVGTPRVYGPPFAGFFYETPASIACVYALKTPVVPGCNPYSTTSLLNPAGGDKAIAIVDAYHDPNAFNDLSFFNGQFGVPGINSGPTGFQVVFAPALTPSETCLTPTKKAPPPAKGTGWDVEESLDIEWAHAMAPGATLYLVEAQSNTFNDLFCAVILASNLVKTAGGGEVSMSWGSDEFAIEPLLDFAFTTPTVVYFASSGDGPGVQYPSASPNVISVGGTTLSRNATSGNFLNENVWQSTGGGPSAFELTPTYQRGVPGITAMRGTPDISADANPFTGVWVYDSVSGPTWYIVGGTSVSSPMVAGIVNNASALTHSFAASTSAELTKLYGDAAGDFNDVTLGSCGLYMGYFAVSGWDFCSGRGSPRGYTGK